MNKTNTGEILAETIDMLTSGKFEIKTTDHGGSVIHQILVDRSEYGKVCGSKGEMIRAIKHLWEVCVSRGQETPIRVTLKEPTDGYAKGRSDTVPAENFDVLDFMELIEDVLNLICETEVNVDDSENRQSLSWDARSKINKIKIEMEDPPDYIKEEFYESCNVLFFAMAKANGGMIDMKFNG